MSRIRMRHVTHVNGSYHTCKWVMAHTSIRHTLYHSCERVVNKWCRVMSHASASRGIMAREVTHVHECIYAHPHAQTHGPCSWSWRNLFCWHSKQSYLSSRPSTCTHRSAGVSGHMCVFRNYYRNYYVCSGTTIHWHMCSGTTTHVCIAVPEHMWNLFCWHLKESYLSSNLSTYTCVHAQVCSSYLTTMWVEVTQVCTVVCPRNCV